MADLNGDGKPDLVATLEAYTNAIEVFLGNGNGTFQAGRTFAAGQYVGSIAIADLNGDGKPDVVVSDGRSSAVSVMLGNGDGSFQSPQTYAVGRYPAAIAMADVNGDGHPDLIVGNKGPGNGVQFASTVSVLLGNGNGTFQPQLTFPAGASLTSMTLADMNGDGKLDLLATDHADRLIDIFLGNGDGTFRPPQTVFDPPNPLFISAGDLNADGKPDLIGINDGITTVGRVSSLLANGNGTFQPQQTIYVGEEPTSFAVVDVNGDGKLDVVVSNFDYHSIGILLGNGDGTFEAQQTVAVRYPGSIAVADVDGDGRPEIVSTTHNGYVSQGLTVISTGSNGDFSGQTYTIVPIPPTVTAVTRQSPTTTITNLSSVTYAVKFSEAVTGVAASDFRVLTSGNLATASPVAVSGSGSSYSVTISGLHGNGTVQLELVDNDTIVDGVGTPLGGPGLGNGSVTGPSYTILQTYPTVLSINRTAPVGPSTADSSVSFTVTFSEVVAGVNATDFALALNGVAVSVPIAVSGSGAVYTVKVSGISGSGTLGLNLVDNGTIRDAAGNPLQSGSPTFAIQYTTSSFAGPTSIAAVDLTGDGLTDLVVANLYTNSGQVFLSNGNGTFVPGFSFLTGTYPTALAVGEFNGDGIPDVVVANKGSNSISVLLGNGNTSFRPQQTFAAGASPRAVAVADVNGDGIPDVVVADYTAGVAVLLGNGNGTFQSPRTFAAGSYLRSIAVSDVNGDGTSDIVVTNEFPGTVTVLLGNGNGTFQGPRTFATNVGPIAVAVADVNGDGIPDLVVANDTLGDGTVGVLLGNGNGSFQAQKTFATGPNPYAVTVSDVNGDGRPDLVVATFYNGPGVLLGNGNGTFKPIQVFPDLNHPVSVAVTDVNGDGRADVVVANKGGDTAGVFVANWNGSFAGQTYTILPSTDSINGTSGNDTITLQRNTDGTDINWTMGASSGQFLANDPAGLTINGNGGNDTINLDYTNGNPLPNSMHLNSGPGNFTINNLQGTNPLAGTAVEIGRSTVFISYGSSDPLAAIQGYLKNGYNAGAWNGAPGATTGVITSAAAAGNANHTTGIGYADWADGLGINTVTNTIELTYTLYGDANLDHQVNSADLQVLLFNLNRPGAWDQGDFNYDAQVNSADLQALLFTLNTSLGSQVAAASAAAGVGQPAGSAAQTGSSSRRLEVPSVRQPSRPSHLSLNLPQRPAKKHR